MRSRPFMIFILVVTTLIVSVVWFVQSVYFAELIKDRIVKYIPSDTGIIGDFSEFRVKIFPPGISLTKPNVVFEKKNIANVPEDTAVEAERIDLEFYPLQMLTGRLRVHEVVIVRGNINITIDPRRFKSKSGKKEKTKGLGLQWDELFQIRAEAIALEDSNVRLKYLNPKIDVSFLARSLRLGQWSGKGGMGYEFDIDLQNIEGSFPKSWNMPSKIKRFRFLSYVNVLGVDIEELSFQSDALTLLSEGRVKGNLLDPKKLLLDLKVNLDGDLKQIFKIVKVKTGPKGKMIFSGKVKGDLLNLVKTISAEGSFNGQKISYQKWSFDDMVLDGKWSSTSRGGILTVTRLDLSSAPRPRIGGVQGGWGGKVLFKPFTYEFGSNERFSAFLELKKAHLHWLAAPATEGVFLMDYRVDGSTSVNFDPPQEGKEWKVGFTLDLKIPRFHLDNQRLPTKSKKLWVLQVPNVTVKGDVSADGTGVDVVDLDVGFGKESTLKAKGRIDFKTGININAKGPVNLIDTEGIAESEIKGIGTIDAKVVGPFDRVKLHFDSELKNAEYLQLKIGDFAGRVTVDIGREKLHFTNMNVKYGQTKYRGNGWVDISGVDDTNFDFKITEGTIQDLISVFDFLHKDYWWFPHSLTGQVVGNVKVGGKVNVKKLKITGSVAGKNWDFYGEKFKAVQLAGGYDSGKYFINQIKTSKHQGEVTAGLSFHPKDGIQWNVLSRNLLLSDLDHVARLDIPLRGNVELKSSGVAKGDRIRSTSHIGLYNILVRGVGLAPSRIGVEVVNESAKFQGTAIGNQAIIDGIYDFRKNKKSSLRAELRQFDFTPVLLLLNPALAQDPKLLGRASGLIDLNFRTGKFEFGNGKIELSEYRLAKTGGFFELDSPVSFPIKNGSFKMNNFKMKGPTSELVANLTSRRAQLDGEMQGTVDLALAEFLIKDVSDTTGTADIDFDFGGTLREPEFGGSIEVNNGELKLAQLESPVKNLRGLLRVRQSKILIDELQGDLANGTVNADGTFELFLSRFPEIDVKIGLFGNRLKVYPFQSAKVSGKLAVKGSELPYNVDGNILVESAVSREEFQENVGGAFLKSAKYTPPPSTLQEFDYPFFKLNIRARADKNVYFKNTFFDAEMRGDVKLVNTIKTPRLLGTADLVQGTMVFRDRKFTLDSAKIEFDNPNEFNPKFSVNANTNIGSNDIKIKLFASGRLDNYKIDLSSDPPLPEAEIQQMLAVGFTSDQNVGAAEREALQQGGAASVILHSTGFNRDLEEKTGFETAIEEAEVQSVEEGGVAIKSEVAPKFVIKRKLGKKVEVSVGTTVGVGTTSQQEAKAEYKVNENLSVMGVYDRSKGESSNQTETQDSFGLDIKLKKKFK